MDKPKLTKTAGILQVFILIAGVVAMSWLMGASFGENSLGRKIVGEKIGKVLGEEVVGVVSGRDGIPRGPPAGMVGKKRFWWSGTGQNRIKVDEYGNPILNPSSCLTPQTKILTPYLEDGTYLDDEMLNKLNNALSGKTRERER